MKKCEQTLLYIHSPSTILRIHINGGFNSDVALVTDLPEGSLEYLCQAQHIVQSLHYDIIIHVHGFLFIVPSTRKLWLSILGWITLGVGQAISIVPFYKDMNRIAK